MKKNGIFLKIIIAAILIKLFLFAFSTLHAPQHRIDPDSTLYLSTAATFSSTGVFATQNSEGVATPDVLKPPGYPFFLAVLHEWLRLPLAGVVFIQILLTLLAAWIVYKTAALIDPATALLSTFIMLYDPTITVISLRILTESLYLFLITSFLFLFTNYLKNGKIRPLLGASLLLVMATYVRPISYFLGAVTAVFMLYANAPRDRKRAVLHALIFFGIIYGLLGLWQLRNYRCCGETDFSTIAKTNFVGYGLFHKYFAWDQTSLAGNIASVVRGVFTATPSFLNFLLCSVSFKYLGWQPLQIAGRVLSYPFMFFWLPGFLVGVYKTRRNILYQFLLLILLYFSGTTVVSLLTNLPARLKIPIIPCLAIFSACGWSFLWPRITGWIEKKRAKNLQRNKTHFRNDPLKRYYYRLLSGYLSVSIRPQDTAVFIDPSPPLLREFPPRKQTSVLWTKSTSSAPIPAGWTLLENWSAVRTVRPDYIVLNGNLHYMDDVQTFLDQVNDVCTSETRVIVMQYSSVWKPLLMLASGIGWRDPMPRTNWIGPEDLNNFARLSNFEVVAQTPRVLLPAFIPLISWFANRWLSQLPLFRLFDLMTVNILRPVSVNAKSSQNRPENGAAVSTGRPSVSVVIPARNESGNIEAAFSRTPVMGPADEWIFVEGHSTDNTWAEIQRCADLYKDRLEGRTIKILRQPGKGKKDAVYAGFAAAKNEVLMILDADLTTPPEDLPKFYRALVEGKGEFINGCRLVYPMEDRAMRFLNMCANEFFALAFSYVLGQPLKDTLCGTKVFLRSSYDRLVAHREFFGNFDPFGDFDLIFGAARLSLKIIEIPVRYRARTYGETNINRFRDGLILFKMLWFAARKLRFL